MGELTNPTEVVLLFDNYSKDSEKLHTSFKIAGLNYTAIAIDDDGFLPEDVISLTGHFLGDFKSNGNIPGRPRYFNQIEVPPHWEIAGTNSNAKIWNLNKERGRIFYAEPKHKRLVKVVDWYDDRGIVRSSDHYNKYGALYARTTFNAKGHKVNKTYFSSEGKEIIVENYVTKHIILNENGVSRIFNSKIDFSVYFMEKNGLDTKRIFFNTLSTCFFVSQQLKSSRKEDVLFWQESTRNEIPGNMRVILNGHANRATKVVVQSKSSYEQLVKLGASKDKIVPLGYIYDFKKENNHKAEALICTNSDNILNCEDIIKALPELHFNIAALTEMSTKLKALDKYNNVSLYPGVKTAILDELFIKCDYYLDINYGDEIVSAVEKAFMHNQLILGFKETLHNTGYIYDSHIYKSEDMDRLTADIKMCMSDSKTLDEMLSKQRSYAMLEEQDSFKNL